MSALGFFGQGLAIGFAIAAPVGPIGMLCIRRTLAKGPAHGLVTGLGAATADAAYGAVAGFGIAAVTDLLLGWEGLLRLVGGIVLLWLGIGTARARPADREATTRADGGLSGAYLSTVALTLANPATIVSFVAVFGGLGLAEGGGDMADAGVLVVGVFLGSALWWLGLSAAVGLLRGRVTPAAMVWINRLSGAVLVGFGAVALASLAARFIPA